MITVLPDNSFQLPNVTDDVLPSTVAPSIKQIKTKQKRFSAFNIIIALLILSLAAGITYFYLPDSKVDKKSIIEVHKTLLDISQQKKGEVKNDGGRTIMNPNDGSSKSSQSKTSESSKKNDKPTKNASPLAKDNNKIIGSHSGAPGDGDDDDEDEKREKRDKDDKKKDGLLSSQQQQSQQSQQSSDGLNDLQENWNNRPNNEEIPLLGRQRN